MARRKKGQKVSGWLLLDKPYGISSTQALGRVRWLFDAQKAGHSGTLDPLATGLLPLAFGEATKTLSFLLDGSKTYVFTVKFGVATTTDDTEGEITEQTKVMPTKYAIEQILPQFTGELAQTPPAYSALKVDGVRAYKKARQGEEVVLKKREVTVERLMLLRVDGDEATFEATVSKGTYIRALGRDMAKALGSCGHITFLRRIAVGQLSLEKAYTLEEVEKKVANLGGKGHIADDLLLPVDWPLDDTPAVTITQAQATELHKGAEITLNEAPLGIVRAKTTEGVLVSLLEVLANKRAKVVRNFVLTENIYTK